MYLRNNRGTLTMDCILDGTIKLILNFSSTIMVLQLSRRMQEFNLRINAKLFRSEEF